MNIIKTETEARTSGTDDYNHGDYTTIAVKTTEGEEIKLRLYGR